MSGFSWLVTGGAGFIGSQIVKQIHDAYPEDRVLVLDKMTYAAMDGIRFNYINCRPGRQFDLHKVDLADRDAVFEVFEEERPNYWIHAAAESHVDRSIDNPGPFIQSNVVGTQNLLDAARQVYRSLLMEDTLGYAERFFRFCYVSTDEVYGPWPEDFGPGFSEEAPFRPTNPYAATKAAAEHLVMAAHKTFRLPVIITRGCNTFGQLQAPEKFLPMMAYHALQNQGLPLYGDGQQQRQWLTVEGHARCIIKAIRTGEVGQVYNISGTLPVANSKVAAKIIDHYGQGELSYVEDRPGHDRRYWITCHGDFHAEAHRQRTDFDGNLQEVLRWYQHHPEWFTNRKLTERAGLNAG